MADGMGEDFSDQIAALEEIDGIVLNKTVNKRKNLAFVLVLDKTSRFGLAD